LVNSDFIETYQLKNTSNFISFAFTTKHILLFHYSLIHSYVLYMGFFEFQVTFTYLMTLSCFFFTYDRVGLLRINEVIL